MLRRLRRPEYTGENRCYPCTAVNLVISAVLSVGVASVLSFVLPVAYALALGFVFLGASLASVWLRGYLVPGTPTLTKRYLPKRVLALFGKAGTGAGATETVDEGVDIEEVLKRADALRFSEEADDLVLTEGFREEWRKAIRDVGDETDADDVLAEIGFEPSDPRVERYEGATAVRHHAGIIRWPSKVALRVDLAAARLLADHLPEWDDYTPETRATLLRGLRIFLDECPDGGRVEMSREAVESCCSVHDVVVLSCSETGERLVEQEV